MPTAHNMNELNDILIKELTKAMNITSDKMLADMYGETYKFYTKGKPKEYQRTGALGDTPRTTALRVSPNKVEFDAYLDQTHKYTTGSYNMTQVLEHAESTHFRSGILGKPKFWMNSEKNMEKTLKSVMGKFFKQKRKG